MDAIYLSYDIWCLKGAVPPILCPVDVDVPSAVVPTILFAFALRLCTRSGKLGPNTASPVSLSWCTNHHIQSHVCYRGLRERDKRQNSVGFGLFDGADSRHPASHLQPELCTRGG